MMLTEIKINANQIHTTRALYDADAGIKFAQREIENQLETGATLENILGNLSVPPPRGFKFDTIDDFETIVPERLFRFSATGHSKKATTTIEASLRRSSALQIGIFGDDQVYMFPRATGYAYDSRIDLDPSNANVAGGSSLGSNGYIDFKSNSYLDGSVTLGQSDSGVSASCSGCSSYETNQAEHIDPDPLGIVGGSLATQMATLSSANDNGSSSLISGGTLYLGPHASGTLSSGSYYLSSVELKSGSRLTLDTSAGPVKLYVTDNIRIWPNSEINNSGSPMNFQIYSPTNNDIKILPKTDFHGFIYAPKADILAMPNGDFNGVIWGNNAYVKPGGRVNVDVALLDQILLNKLNINHWKEVRSE
jgi:hypothetical protein